MRPGQNRRVRGRTNRKGPNPLTRSYESNGPDVKIRGTAQHIAEKYTQLARDAQVAGDPVASENYLQHAEHYFRIIAAAQSQYQQAYGVAPRLFDDGDEGDLDDEFQDGPIAPRQPSAGVADEAYPVGAPQPGQAAAPAYRERQERFERPQRGERFERQDRSERSERQPRQERPERQDRQPRVAVEGAEPRTDGDREPRGRRERFRRDRPPNRELDLAAPADVADDAGGLPAFLTTPLSAPVRASAPVEVVVEAPAAVEVAEASAPQVEGAGEAAAEDGGERFPVRARRRRGRTRAEGQADGADAEQSAAG